MIWSLQKILALIIVGIFIPQSTVAISFLAKNDPYPMYSSIYDPYLSVWERQCMMGNNNDTPCYESWAIDISPFVQKASSGRNFGGNKVFLSDLEGRWNMLGMLYGPRPIGQQLAPQLLSALRHIFSDIPANDNTVISDSSNYQFLLTDTSMDVGFFSIPLKYTKYGLRFELSMHAYCDFGVTIQGGISEIKQTYTHFIDRGTDQVIGAFVPLDFLKQIPDIDTGGLQTCASVPECTTPFAQIEGELMSTTSAAKFIFEQLGLEKCNFEETSFEDFRFIFWWRRPYAINTDRDYYCWPEFIIMPSVAAFFTAPIAKPLDRHKLFSLPFGNDGHFSAGVDLGLNLDFYETVELAFKLGFTHFFGRTISDFRVPNFEYQSGIFPFATEVKRNPGNNYNFNVILNAHRFIACVSAYVEYVLVKHEEDHICLTNPDSAFIPEKIECTSKFMSQFISGALSVEISPNISLGLLGQFPIQQRNAYRSTTWLGTFRAVF